MVTGPIKAVLYTRFEDIEGYVVSASAPPGVMVDQFKDIGYQFLPDRGLCWRLISLGLGDYRMIGVPVHIEDSRYPRRAFVFCFCVLVDDNDTQAVRLGKVAAQCLAEEFFNIETDPEFHLLSDDERHTDMKFSMESFLEDVKGQLNDRNSDCVSSHVIGDYYLEFSKPRFSAPVDAFRHFSIIQPWHVPVSLIDSDSIERVSSSTFILKSITEACNGCDTVLAVSERVGLPMVELVDTLNVLRTHQLVYIIDQTIDKCTRVRLTSKFHSYFDESSNRQEAVGYCLVPQMDAGPTTSSGTHNLGDFLVRMYCKLDGHVAEIGELDALLKGSSLSTRHMIVYGLIRGFLRIKTMYPYFNYHESTMVPILRQCDGKSSWDEICHRCAISRPEFLEQISHHDVLKIWK